MPLPPRKLQYKVANKARPPQITDAAKFFASGLAFHKQGQLSKAKSIYEQVLKMQPQYFDALHLLGVIANQTNNPELAVALIDKAIAINANSAAAHSNRAVALQKVKRWDEALASCDRAISIKADFAEAHSNRGNALQALKRWDEALASYDRAIAIKPDYADALSNRGNALHKLKRLDEAVSSYSRAIAIKPDYVEAHSNCGNALQELKRWDQAIASYKRAIAIKPDHAEAYSNCGNALLKLKRFDEAVSSYSRAIAIKPDYVEAHSNRGNALQELKRWDQALASYERAIAIKLDFAEAHSNRGNALQALKRWDEALASYDRAITIKPDYADALYNRGNALLKLKRLDEAVSSYSIAITIKPDYLEAYFNRGNALQELKRWDQALASYELAIAIKPDHAEAYSNRGNALHELKRLDQALASFERAIVIKPDYADAYSNRGFALQELKRWDEALASYDRAITIKPDHAEAYSNRGNVLHELKRWDEALASYDRAIAIKPDYADALFNKSILLLLRGEFEKGWKLYDWRLKKNNFKYKEYKLSKNLWYGQRLDGRLLVLPEQGIGDQIFYLGMLHQLEVFVDSVCVAIDKRLISIFQRSFKNIHFVPEEIIDNNTIHDAYIFMGSLAKYFRSDAEELNNVRRGYLKACDQKTLNLRKNITDGKKLICGISWKSKNLDLGTQKSINLDEWIPILSIENYKFVDLQYGDTQTERRDLQTKTGVAITRLEEIDNFNDLDGLASLICACDVIVTVSNTTAHLAAALGKPVLIILPEGRGLLHYWGLDSSESIWYPSAVLYRQDKIGDWPEVIARVATDLQRGLPKDLTSIAAPIEPVATIEDGVPKVPSR